MAKLKKNKEIKYIMKIIFFGDSLTEGSIGSSYIDILKKKYPEYDLINCGKNGDSVISLYNRISKMDFFCNYDIAFLWIGTNDVFAKVNTNFSLTKMIFNTPCAKEQNEFVHYYKMLIEYIQKFSNKIITVLPWFIGEDFSNPWNKDLGKLSEATKKISKSYKVEYIDIRKIIIDKFSKNTPSDYIPRSNMRVLFDFLTLKNNEQVDKKSKERGLYFTVDGAHLNSVSANIIAEVFSHKINNMKKDS